ncbi:MULTISPECIES: N-formylglutamate amidohydrolase [Alphaproteobacteria]|uniref:N-formylglutamate amidohydrolase n=2 Tax=Alphaproteobacteria TaxID=28211 RepID=A0A512HKY2_9HYPH|nr:MULTISPECIES: N-formylglutamate amidohydrolase [Alphaproteobacteria]GEO86060.1 N-formylglutamate amidohydrolase [Ciceribacter naphthalenivorans]GLR22147.1 N-formylglutamate amidohydrolase [Ciceribacter naphthalenivorans]GLT05003.1 N-formylglutamate amidohydrolase [Sphingomonas psychrolutea]
MTGDFDLFEVREPETQSIPFVYNSPHSGRRYPLSFLDQSRLDDRTIRRSEDHYVDELFGAAPAFGAPMLLAHFPRAFVDVNREPYELDPKMFSETLPPYANINSARVAGGLGTIPRIVAENVEIYARRLPLAEALERIEAIYKPYHACLRRLIARTHARFGFGVLIDCHSMPGNIRVAGSGIHPDFIIGDRYGTSASSELSQAALEFLEGLGFLAVRNKPYAGGFITEHYGRPARGLHALQIEVNRALYIDEATLAKRGDFNALAGSIAIFMQQMAEFVADYAGDTALAAE